MGDAVRALIAAVLLGGTFGSATATVESIDGDVMTVDIAVEVLDPADSVVAHLSFEEESDLRLPLLERDDGTFGLRTELKPRNYVVVFETVGDDGERSEPTTLAQMGADLAPVVSDTATTVDDEGMSDESLRLLWLAVALGAGSLSLLAFWVLGGRDNGEADKGEADTGDTPAEVRSEEE